MAIVIIIVAIVSIIAFIVLISMIILQKLTICKILNISSIMVIICHNRRLELGKKFFKGYYKNKQYKFQLRDSVAYSLSSSNKLVFAHIIKT